MAKQRYRCWHAPTRMGNNRSEFRPIRHTVRLLSVARAMLYTSRESESERHPLRATVLNGLPQVPAKREGSLASATLRGEARRSLPRPR